MTPEQARADLARLQGKGLDNVMANTIRRGARRMKKRAIADIGSRGIGRRIWGKKPKGLEKILSIGRVQREGPASISITLTAKGIPALIEEGGKTAPHKIKAFRRGPKGRRLLSFRKAGGEGAVAEVQHPGSAVAKDPWIGPAGDAESPQTERELLAAVDVFAGL